MNETDLTIGPLSISPTGVGSTLITVCFLRGTRIATPDGERLIEALKVNDLVTTADGKTLPIRWIGVNTISTRFADPIRNLPIRIQAGALAENVPVHDLLVSPGHAMLVDGLLIHAGALVNGVTITRETNMPETFVYYHIELENHALILAEGAPAETFIDNIDRMAFDNWADRQQIVGEDDAIAELDLPRVKSARQLPPHVRAILAARQAFLVPELAAAA